MDALADNLRRLRKRAKLTQAQLAEAASLPRATVASLEQAGANPGIHTVMAVAKALGVGLDELMTPVPELRHYKVVPRDMQEYRADEGRYAARLISPIASKGVQMHHVTLHPGCRSLGRPHPPGSQEYFFTLEGTARIQIEDEVVTVEAGCLLQFPGHRSHTYEHVAGQPCQAVSVVVFRLS